MTALRLLAALACAGAVVTAGAWSGGAFARGSAPHAMRAASYPGASGEAPVGDSLEAAGQPLRLSVFHTEDAPSRVIAFYGDAFAARGLLPVVSVDDAFAHVAVFDPGDGLQRFVSALRGPDLRTLVIAGTADPGRPARLLQGSEATSLPVPPEHRTLLAFRSADGEARAESAQFLSALPATGIAAFYRGALAKEGYLEGTGAGAALLTFRKERTSFSIASGALPGGQGSAVFVTRIEGEQR